MRKATRITAASFGFIAGIAGLEHGYFEILQGNIRPPSIMFASMGSLLAFLRRSGTPANLP